MELKQGQLVCYRGIWNGKVLDCFTSKKTGKTIVHIMFVKNVYYGQRYDVIEYHADMFKTSTLEKMKQEALEFECMKNEQLERLGVCLPEDIKENERNE